MLAVGAALPLLPSSPGLPCPLRSVTGIPCPLCGMTTSVEATLHLDLAGAVAANPAGVVLLVLAVVLLLARPARLHLPPTWAIVAGTAVVWAWELRRFGVV